MRCLQLCPPFSGSHLLLGNFCGSIQISASLLLRQRWSLSWSLWSRYGLQIRAGILHVIISCLSMLIFCYHWNRSQRAKHRGWVSADDVHETLGVPLGQSGDPCVRPSQWLVVWLLDRVCDTSIGSMSL